MAHFKRRRRRRGGIKGHCYLCALRRTNGTRNGRLLTHQEQAHILKLAEELDEADLPRVSLRAIARASRGLSGTGPRSAYLMRRDLDA